MKKLLLASFLSGAVFIGLTSEIMSDNGIAGRTGSPGETNCTNCHNSFALNSGGGTISLNTGTTNNEYVPGTTYNMTFTVSRTGNSLFGLGVEALNSSNANAGSLIITNAASTHLKSVTVSGNSRTSVVHQLNGGASANSKAFVFNWTAPAAGTGNVTFYYCGVAANGNGNESSDYVYQGSTVLTEMNTAGISSPDQNTSFSVFPSLVNDEATIELTSAVTGNALVQLFDLTGKVVRSETISVVSGNEQSIRWTGLSQFSKGTYLVNVQTGSKNNVKRIVLQ